MQVFIKKRFKINKNGEKKYGYSMYHSKRINGKPRRFTVLNLGTDFAVPEEYWKLLSDHVADQLRQKPVDLSESPEVVRRYFKDIMTRLKAKAFDIDKIEDIREAVIVDKTELENIRTIGGERLAKKVLEELGFPEFFTQLGFSTREIQVSMLLLMGRMLSPGSELHTYHWSEKYSGVQEVLGLTDLPPSKSSLYRTGDLIYRHRDLLIDKVFNRTQKILGFEPRVVFYDLTNTYYTGRKRGFLLRHGRSKEKRMDLPLVTLGLVIDASGFPRSAKLYPGNMSEPKTFEGMIDAIGVSKGTTVVMDAGISTESNLEYLNDLGLRWITVERKRPDKVPSGEPDCVLDLSEERRLYLWEVSRTDSDRLIYVHSTSRKKVEDELLRVKREAFEQGLKKLDEGLSRPRRLKDLLKVTKAVGRLEERYKAVSHHYEVKVVPKENSTHASEVLYEEKPLHKQRTDTSGGYYIKSNRMAIALEELVTQYHKLNDIEQTFRVLKSDLHLRPIFHRKDCRIIAHIYIAILAYFGVQLIRTRLKAEGVDASWGTIQIALRNWVRGDVLLKKTDQKQIKLSMDAKAKGLHEEIRRIMGMSGSRNLVRENMTVPQKCS